MLIKSDLPKHWLISPASTLAPKLFTVGSLSPYLCRTFIMSSSYLYRPSNFIYKPSSKIECNNTY